MTEKIKGRFTFRFTAICFALSAAFELLNLNDEAYLLGHIVVGGGAMIYHIGYAVLFAWLTTGLWNGTRSGYQGLWIVTIIYTVDRLQALFIGDALATSLRHQIADHPEVLEMIAVDDLLRIVTVTVLTMVALWWAFVAYAYYRRDYFSAEK